MLDATRILDAELVPEQLDSVLEALEQDPTALLEELKVVRESKRIIWGK